MGHIYNRKITGGVTAPPAPSVSWGLQFYLLFQWINYYIIYFVLKAAPTHVITPLMTLSGPNF